MHDLDSERLIALSDAQQSIVKLDNEALLAKFLDANANFIAVGLLARQFQEPRYSQLRDELYMIDVEVQRRALFRAPQHKTAVKAAHDQAWQVSRIARPNAVNSSVRGSPTGDRESAGPVAWQDATPASASAAVPASQAGDRKSADPVVQQDPPSASTSAAVPASQTGDRESADPIARPPPASTSAAVPASQAVDRESADLVALQDTPPISTSAAPSRTSLAAWRDAIFALGHRRTIASR
jgi:hypothetical protein